MTAEGRCAACGAMLHRKALTACARVDTSLLRGEQHRPGARAHKKKSKRAIGVFEHYPEPSTRLRRLMNVWRLFDRNGNWYSESVRDAETGEVVHSCEQPLNEHRSRASAAKKKR